MEATTGLLPLHPIHEGLGAQFAELAGRRVPRHYGDPAAEYAAVRTAAGIVDRADRAQVRVFGRDPVKMIHGLVTNDVAGAPEGQGVYAAFLTHKGKMVADVRVFRRPAGDVLLDLDAAALEGLLAHLRKFIPPIFARFEDVSASLGVLGVYGPRARETVEAALRQELSAGMQEDAFAILTFQGSEVLVARTLYTGEDGYDLFAPVEALEPLWRALTGAGARPVGHGPLETLRIEAGRPRWGAELDENVIPLEAGLKDRAISQTKGCYTGQEVIIRILHRGHVNWLLRGFLLGDTPAPPKGTIIVRPDDPKPVGRVTSACASPRHRQTIALGYLRRELGLPLSLRLGQPDGPELLAVELPFPSTDLGEPFREPAEA